MLNFSQEEMNKAVESCKGGALYGQVADDFGVSVHSVVNWCRKAGLRAGWKQNGRKKGSKNKRNSHNSTHVYACHKCRNVETTPFEHGQHLKNGCHSEITPRTILSIIM